MRRRHIVTALASAGVAAVLTVGVGGIALADDREVRPGAAIAACQHRFCLRLVDLTADSDGDGYADVDEEWAGTDPRDPTSYPGMEVLVEGFVGGSLPSFDAHLTEVVVLPVLTPDRGGIASILGRLDLPLPARSAMTVNGMLDQLRQQGLDPLDIMATLTAKRSSGVYGGRGQVPWSGTDGLGWLRVPNRGLYGLGAPGLGGGGGASGAKITKWENHKDGSTDFRGSQSYPDGSRAEFYGSREKTGSYFVKDPDGTSGGGFVESGTLYQFVIEYFDGDGHKTSEEQIELRVDKKGNTSGKVTKITFDPKTGERTGKTESTCLNNCPAAPQQPANSSSATTSESAPQESSTQTSPQTSTQTSTSEADPSASKSGDGGAGPDSYCDSGGDECYANSVTFALTPSQERALLDKITGGWVTTPGPDEGKPLTLPEGFDPNWDPDAPIKFVTDEGYGVVVISSEPPERFNAPQPEYPQDYEPLYTLGGVGTPPCGPGGTSCTA